MVCLKIDAFIVMAFRDNEIGVSLEGTRGWITCVSRKMYQIILMLLEKIRMKREVSEPLFSPQVFNNAVFETMNKAYRRDGDDSPMIVWKTTQWHRNKHEGKAVPVILNYTNQNLHGSEMKLPQRSVSVHDKPFEGPDNYYKVLMIKRLNIESLQHLQISTVPGQGINLLKYITGAWLVHCVGEYEEEKEDPGVYKVVEGVTSLTLVEKTKKKYGEFVLNDVIPIGSNAQRKNFFNNVRHLLTKNSTKNGLGIWLQKGLPKYKWYPDNTVDIEAVNGIHEKDGTFDDLLAAAVRGMTASVYDGLKSCRQKYVTLKKKNKDLSDEDIYSYMQQHVKFELVDDLKVGHSDLSSRKTAYSMSYDVDSSDENMTAEYVERSEASSPNKIGNDGMMKHNSADKVMIYQGSRKGTNRQLDESNVDAAKEFVKLLLRKHTAYEVRRVDDVLYSVGAERDVVGVKRESWRRLKPGLWLNDEIMNSFLSLVNQSDERNGSHDSTRQRMFILSSYFFEKMAGKVGYRYDLVKNWTNRCPGRDIFAISKVVIPINIGNYHWTCVVVYMDEKRIQFYDSKYNGEEIDYDWYMKKIFMFLKDEYFYKKGEKFPNEEAWCLKHEKGNTPQQRNGKKNHQIMFIVFNYFYLI